MPASRTKQPAPSPSSAVVFGDLRSYSFGKALYPPKGRLGPRIQADYQLVVLLRGSLRVAVGDQAHELSPGDAILQHPGEREFYRFAPEAESEHTWCHIAPSLLSPSDRRAFRHVRGVHHAPAAVHLLIEEGLAPAGSSQPELHDAMAALARACLLRFAAQVRLSRSAAPAHPAVRRALDIIAADYRRLRTMEELARRTGISATRLRVLFRESGRESPRATIWRLKTERAIQLIRSTGLTLDEIAHDCGYASPFHLSRSVRDHTGHSPRHLRQHEWNMRA